MCWNTRCWLKHAFTYQILVAVFLASDGMWVFAKQQNNKTVNIGVILGRFDERSAAINRTVGIAMKASNNSIYVNLNPVKTQTSLTDSYALRKSICDLIKRKTIALMGSSRSDTFSIIESYSRALQVPFFIPTLTREATTQRQNYIISMCPSFTDAVIDFIGHFHWNRIFYLFDSDDALWRLQKLYEAFSDRRTDGRKKPFQIVAIRIPDVSNCREVLRKLDRNYNYSTKRMVVDLYSLESYNKFMSQIIDVGMNRDGYHYLLGTMDILHMREDLWRSFIFGGVNITGFQFVKRTHSGESLAEMLNQPTPLSLEGALTVDAVAILTKAIVSLVKPSGNSINDTFRFQRGELNPLMSCSSNPVMPLEQGDIIMKRILETTENGLTGRLALDKYGHRKEYILEIYHLSYRSLLEHVGGWEHGRGFVDFKLEPPGAAKPKSPNATKIITTIINQPFVQEKEKDDDGKPVVGNDRFEGYCIDMIKIIAEKANFTYSLQIVHDKEYGTKLPQGGWTGMIGELINGTADLALASLSITHKREEAVYFTKPYMNTGISIMIKKPEREKPGVFSFMDPLSLAVWSCIIAGFFVVSFILYMVGRFSPYEWQEEGNGGSTLAPSDTFSFVNTLWFSLGALMQQGPDIFPRSLSGRVLASAWWFFTLITISSYTANLAAFLTFERLIKPINSVDDLVNQDKIKYGSQKSGSTHDFFKDSKVDIYRKMYEVMKDSSPSVYESDSKTGWQRVISDRGKYAFLLESASNNYYNQRKPCKTIKVGRNLDRKGYGVAMPKYSDLRQSVNIAVLEMAERGDLLKLEQKWWYSKGECGNADGGEKGKNALNLSNVSGIFHILIGGLVLAMVISLSQIVFHTKIKKRVHRDAYRVNNDSHPEVRYQRPVRRVTIEHPPVITCTTSNGGEPHLISFDDDVTYQSTNIDDISSLNDGEIT